MDATILESLNPRRPDGAATRLDDPVRPARIELG
jgi:hypothetical protein